MLDLQFAESLRFRCPGGGFGAHFGRLLVTRGSLFLVFEGTGRGWNFDGFLLISRGSSNSDFAEVRGEFTPDEVPTVNLQLQTADSNQQLEERKLLISI